MREDNMQAIRETVSGAQPDRQENKLDTIIQESGRNEAHLNSIKIMLSDILDRNRGTNLTKEPAGERPAEVIAGRIPQLASCTDRQWALVEDIETQLAELQELI